VPSSNFTSVWRETSKRRVEAKIPRTIDDLRKDVYARFLGFPRRVGTSLLFDHDKDNGNIRELRNEHALFAWIGEKSRHVTPWMASGPDGFVSKKELFSSLVFNSVGYERISSVPDYPIRKDVYYKPSKPTALAFAVALELELRETEELLEKAGFAISHSSKMDLVIEYCIRERFYDVMQINEVLYELDLPLLGNCGQAA
jgi:hypothetical protein